MKKHITLIALCSLGFAFNTVSLGQAYKDMMHDPTVNFYDACTAAESYFATHDRGKGSGWKAYQRWRSENESRYFPSGDRSNVDPRFAAKAYRQFLSNYESQNQFGAESFENGWRELGPSSVDNITSHYSPGIGRVEAFWVNPNNTNQIYLGSRSGGFWKTNDEGASWVNTTDTLVAAGVNTIAVSPTNPDSILINVRNGGNGTTHGIYRSIDGGDTWMLSNFNNSNLNFGGLGTNHQIYKIAYHPLDPKVVFVGTNRGLYRSEDGLETFTEPLTTGEFTDIEFHPSDPDIVFVYNNQNGNSNRNKVLRSFDRGLSFASSQAILNNNNREGFIAVSPACDSCVYFASDNGVWTSTDTGNTFSFNSNPNESCDGFAVSDVNPQYMIYGYVDMAGSSNGGNTFFQITDWSINGSSLPSDYVHADLRTAECVNGVFYVGTDGYLCKSTDNGNNWTLLNNGTGIREFYAVGISQSDWRVQMAGSQDNGTSILDGTGWIEWNGGDGMEALVQPLRPDWMIGSWQFGTRNTTRDAGQSRQASGNPEGGSGEADWVAPMLMNPSHQMDIYHFGSNVYRSPSFGVGEWELVGSPLIGIITQAEIAHNNADIMMISRANNIRLSTDGGASFVGTQNGLPNHWITDIAFDPSDDSTVVVTYNRYQNDLQKVYITHDLGTTWNNITNNLGNMPIRTVVMDHSPDRNIYVGGEIGVYYKAMGDTEWQLYSNGLPNATVRDLEIQYGTNVLRAATWGRGLWDYKLVGRAEYPAIPLVEVSQFPMQPEPALLVDQYITAAISYDGELSDVYVLWSDSTRALNNIIAMSNTQDSTWVSNTYIPHQEIGTDVYFKVVAVGENADTTETYHFHYVAMQEPPEVIDNTAVVNVKEPEPFSIYPNPSSGNFTIERAEKGGELLLTVSDINGRVIYERKTNESRIALDLKEPAGTYYLSISEASDSQSKAYVTTLIIE